MTPCRIPTVMSSMFTPCNERCRCHWPGAEEAARWLSESICRFGLPVNLPALRCKLDTGHFLKTFPFEDQCDHVTFRNICADSATDHAATTTTSTTTTLSPSTTPILLRPPSRPAPISTKWISWPALSVLVRYSNETALSAHHLSARQPAPRSTVSTVSVCRCIGFNSGT